MKISMGDGVSYSLKLSTRIVLVQTRSEIIIGIGGRYKSNQVIELHAFSSYGHYLCTNQQYL